MKRILVIIALTLLTANSFAAKDEHASHSHEPAHNSEGNTHDLGHVSVGSMIYEVTLHGEIIAGEEAIVSIMAQQGQPPKEIRVWIGKKNGRGSVKSLLRGDSHGHFHGHLEVPAKVTHDSAIWLDVRTKAGRERGSVAIPEQEHAH